MCLLFFSCSYFVFYISKNRLSIAEFIYKTFTCTFNDAPFAAGYNHLAHSFDFISLSSSDNFFISLDKERANGCLPTSGFFKPISAVLENESGIIAVAYKSKVINRIPYPSIDKNTQ